MSLLFSLYIWYNGATFGFVSTSPSESTSFAVTFSLSWRNVSLPFGTSFLIALAFYGPAKTDSMTTVFCCAFWVENCVSSSTVRLGTISSALPTTDASLRTESSPDIPCTAVFSSTNRSWLFIVASVKVSSRKSLRESLFVVTCPFYLLVMMESGLVNEIIFRWGACIDITSCRHFFCSDFNFRDIVTIWMIIRVWQIMCI